MNILSKFITYKRESNASANVKNPKLKWRAGYPEVNNWVVSKFIVDMLIPVVGIHPYPLAEVQLMVDAVCWVKPRKIIEWGTHIGVAAKIFSETIDYFNISGKVYSIDLPDTIAHVEHPHGERGKLVKNAKNVVLIQGDGMTEAGKILRANKGVGALVFLDGDHAYSSVKRELTTLGKNYPHASILVHDTFNQTENSRYNVGPHQAVIEFMAKYARRYDRYETCLSLPGMTLLLPKTGV